MNAIVVEPKNKGQLSLVKLSKPDLKPDEALVKTISVGIDATDLEIYAGAYGQAPKGQRHLVAGHEAVGQIAAVGDRVSTLQEGDFVVPLVRAGCGTCPPCDNDEPDMCQRDNFTERGIKGAHGFLSDFFSENENNLVRLPSALVPFGALVEPLSVGEKAVEHAFRIQERFAWKPDKIIVFGAGSLGILTTLALHAKGYDAQVFDIENEDSLKAAAVRALESGYIDGNKISINNIPENYGRPDLVFDATGNSKVAWDGLTILDKNGLACLLGVTSGDRKNEICTDCLNDQLVMNNNVVFGSVSSNRRHFLKAIDTLTFALSKWPDALDLITANRIDFTDYRKAFQKDFGIKTIIDLVD